MRIPEDIHGAVLDLATKLVNARETGNTKAFWLHYDELRRYCECQPRPDGVSPFLLETLADFTDDDCIATDLYLKALALATAADAAPYRASIQLALAERQHAMGNHELAFSYASAANEEAQTLDDLDLRRSISEFLLNESKHI